MVLLKSIAALLLSVVISTAYADVLTFEFTGRLIVASGTDEIVPNDNGLPYTPIAASLTFDTDTGLGSSDLEVSFDGSSAFLGAPATFKDVTISDNVPGDKYLDGNVLVDWNYNLMNMHVNWDATGLYNAIDFGLQVGDTISGTDLIRGGSIIHDVLSADPYSDYVIENFYTNRLVDGILTPDMIQGPAPLAATQGSYGFQDGPFIGVIRGYIDIGSGNSMHVTSISSSVVPVPAAIWLFGSGLIALIGFTARKH